MITKEVVEYIKNEIKKGTTKEVITSNLISGGNWRKSDIEEAFIAIDKEKNTAATLPSEGVPATTVAPVATPNIAPVVEQTHKSLFGRIVTRIFGTKLSSAFWFFLINFIFITFILPISPVVFPGFSYGPFAMIMPFIFWILLIAILVSLGYTREVKNIFKGFATVVLVFLAIGLIGFGICVLMLQN